MPDDSFKELVPDPLSALPELRARAMFGAHGLYPGQIASCASPQGAHPHTAPDFDGNSGAPISDPARFYWNLNTRRAGDRRSRGSARMRPSARL
jgi:hypothetical protein